MWRVPWRAPVSLCASPGAPVGSSLFLFLFCTQERPRGAPKTTAQPPSVTLQSPSITLPTAVGHPPTAVGYPPTAVGYPPTASVTLQPPSSTLPTTGGYPPSRLPSNRRQLPSQPLSIPLQPPSLNPQPPSVSLQPPSVTVALLSVTLQPPSVTPQPPSATPPNHRESPSQPPSATLQPPSVIPPNRCRLPSNRRQFPSNSRPLNPKQPSVTLQPPSVTVALLSVTLQPPSLTVALLSVALQPALAARPAAIRARGLFGECPGVGACLVHALRIPVPPCAALASCIPLHPSVLVSSLHTLWHVYPSVTHGQAFSGPSVAEGLGNGHHINGQVEMQCVGRCRRFTICGVSPCPQTVCRAVPPPSIHHRHVHHRLYGRV